MCYEIQYFVLNDDVVFMLCDATWPFYRTILPYLKRLIFSLNNNFSFE